MEAEKEKMAAQFEALVNAGAGKRPGLLDKIQMWRVDRAEGKVNRLEAKIRQHAATKLTPLQTESAELDEEITPRSQLAFGK